MVYERLLNKKTPPSEENIEKYLGAESYRSLQKFEKFLSEHYCLKKELRFPFGNSYGWGYKYSHKSSHLCYAFFEAGAFTVTLQLGDPCVPVVEKMLPSLSDKAKELWQNRYPCGKRGGWLHYRVMNPGELADVLQLITVKKKTAK